MYTPSFNRIDDEDEIRRFVAEARSAQFITVSPDGTPVATLLPVIWDGNVVVAHERDVTVEGELGVLAGTEDDVHADARARGDEARGHFVPAA